MQMIPRKTSRTDQYVAGTLSYVGLVEAKLMMLWRRTIETIVVL
jgi:hypothetical protein